MAITTTDINHVTPGMVILKRVSDGHYYGTVAAVEVLTSTIARITYTDGEVQKKSGTIIVKEV